LLPETGKEGFRKKDAHAIVRPVRKQRFFNVCILDQKQDAKNEESDLRVLQKRRKNDTTFERLQKTVACAPV